MQKLLKRFVPCADEVGHLQRAKTPAAELFRVFCDEGHYQYRRKKGSGTRQGIYAVAPSGKLLRSWNTRGIRNVERELKQALEAWDELDEAERYPEEALAAGNRAEDHYPTDGLALVVYTRDLPREKDTRADDWQKRAWNLDHLWLSSEEARALAAGALPEAALQRLVRLHGRDSVRGQTQHYRDANIIAARLEVEAGLQDGAIQFMTFTGEASLSQTGQWQTGDGLDTPGEESRSFAGTMYGKATWNGARFTEFELAWTGLRTGATKYNQRAEDQGPAPMAVVFRLADAEDRVAPSRFWDYGWR